MAVYIVQRPHAPRDWSSAQRYGRLEFIFDDPTFQPSQQPAVAARAAEEVLLKFNPTEDYLVMAGGDPSGPFLIGGVFARLFPGVPMPVLRWEREKTLTGDRSVTQGFYVPVRFHI